MIYLDNAATTLMDPQIISSHQEYMHDHFANSGAVYEIGLDAKKKIEEATECIRDSLGVPNTHNLVYTSGGTESNNLFIKGLCFILTVSGLVEILSQDEKKDFDL